MRDSNLDKKPQLDEKQTHTLVTHVLEAITDKPVMVSVHGRIGSEKLPDGTIKFVHTDLIVDLSSLRQARLAIKRLSDAKKIFVAVKDAEDNQRLSKFSSHELIERVHLTLRSKRLSARFENIGTGEENSSGLRILLEYSSLILTEDEKTMLSGPLSDVAGALAELSRRGNIIATVPTICKDS